MHKPPSTPTRPWWSAKVFRKPEPVPDTDYADMGTAFGLDASMKPPGAEGVRPAVGDAGPASDRLNRRSVL